MAAIAAGILAARFIGFHQPELFLAIAAFLLLGWLALSRRARALAGVCGCLGMVCAGALTALLHAPGPAPELDVEGSEVAILGGCVVEPPAISGERERFVLELERHARAQVTLYTREGETLPALRYGQNIEVDARVRPPRNFGNPGAFDYARFLAREEVFWTASGAAGTVRVLPGRCGSRLQGFAMDLRAAALGRIARLFQGSEYNTGMMQALLIGQTYQLKKVWTQDYRSTGTFHALVISGTHVAILAAFFLFALRLCFVPEQTALVVTVAAAWLYAMVIGWHAPCVRAAAGLTMLAACGFFHRRRRPMNLLAAVALAFLVFDPEQLFDASFQLTFLAVAFLGAFAAPLIQATSGPLARGLAGLDDTGRDLHLPPRVAQFRVEMRLLAETLRRVAHAPPLAARLAITLPARVALFAYEIAAVSAAIQMGLALPMVVYFHRVGISGLSANVFVIPLLGVAVPLGFAALLTGWVWVAKAVGGLLWLSQQVAVWHAAREPHWRIPTPPLWLAVAFSVALIAAAVARGRWLRVAAGAAVAALLALLLWRPFPPDTHLGQLEMDVIDVGQGDSIFVALPDGRRMLVDAGGIPAFRGQAAAQLDIGEDVVAPYLWTRGIGSLDVVVASHGHEDHIGGMPAIIEDFHPKELWIGAEPDSAPWRAVRAAAARNGVKIVSMQSPMRFAYGGAEAQVLAPLEGYVPSAEARNDDSLVLRLAYGRHAFLLTGDVERPIERAMLDADEIQRADVLKVPHHGSRTSSTGAFLDAVAPAFAVVSLGFENSYGFPNHEVLERLRERRAMVFRTDLDGLVSIRGDGRRLHLETNREMRGGGVTPAW